MSQASRRRRWYQFSLRTLLVVLMLAAGGAGVVHILVEPYRRQQEAIAVIKKCFGSYTTEEPARWVRWLDKNVQDVVVADVADCDQPDEYLPHLLRLPKLRTLVVGGHQFTDDHLHALRSALSLRGLVFDSTKVTPEGLDGLKEALPDLEVWKSERRACVELKKVSVETGHDDPDAPRERRRVPVAAPERLRTDVSNDYFADPVDGVNADSRCTASDVDLAWLADLKALRGLSIDGSQSPAAFLAHVRPSPLFEHAVLARTKNTDVAMACVSRFSSLGYLDLNQSSLTDDGVAHLRGFEYLEYLDLGHTSIGDRSVGVVAELPSLLCLSLEDTLVTDAGLARLARSKTLKAMFLAGTRITDLAVPHLQECAHVEALSIGRTNISPDGARKLRSALPRCRIEPDQ